MKHIYTLREELTHDQEMGTRRCYGIVCHTETGNLYIPDISQNKKQVEMLAERFNRYKLSPMHFHDAVEEELE